MATTIELDSSDPVVELKIKVKVLEQEASKRQELNEAGIAHNEATVKSFGVRVMATLMASVTSECVYNIMLVFVNTEAHTGSPPGLPPHDEFWVRFGYAVLASIVCPFVLFWLRPSSGNTKGYTFLADFLKLIAGCVPMILAWSYMDMLLALMKWAGNPGWDELITAVVLTVVVSGLEFLPCYRTAKAGVADGSKDTLFNRYLILPASMTLAVGRMWNEFVSWPIDTLQAKVSHQPTVSFLIQLVYWIVITYLIIQITACWSEKQESLRKQLGEEDKYHISSMEHHAMDMERSMGGVFIGCFSFVYAWALNDTIQDFWFNLMNQCSGSSSCGYANNCAYAVILTIIFGLYTATVQFQDRREPWGKAHQALQVLAMSLCVGWAWKGYFMTTITALEGELNQGRVYSVLALFFVLWAFGGMAWHSFLKEQRRRKIQRDNDFKKTKVIVTAEEIGSSSI